MARDCRESRFPVGSSAQDDRRVVQQRAGNGDPLLFAARKCPRAVIGAFFELHEREQFVDALTEFAHWRAVNEHRQRDVLARRERRKQVVFLEDDADAPPGEKPCGRGRTSG